MIKEAEGEQICSFSAFVIMNVYVYRLWKRNIG